MEKIKRLLSEDKSVVVPLLQEIAGRIDIASGCDIFLQYLRLHKAMRDYAKGVTKGGAYNLPELAAVHEPEMLASSPKGLLCHHVGNTICHLKHEVLQHCAKLKISERRYGPFVQWCNDLERFAYGG